MRILVLSDSHGLSSPMEQAIERSNPNLLIFLGDGIDQILSIKKFYTDINFYMVKGNCDFSSSAKIFDIITINEKRIFFTHGHNYNVKHNYDELTKVARNLKADIALFGHTHAAYSEYNEGLYLLNPGSVSRSSNGHPSYGIVDITPQGIVTNIVNISL